MDWVGFWQNLKKYRLVLIAALFGILLMWIPEQKQETQIPEKGSDTIQDLEMELSDILSKVDGAGTVEVLLSLREGAHTVYQCDETIHESDVRRDTVLVNNADRAEVGLIRQINPPVYQGAIILCRGAQDAEVRLALVEAVKSVTGLSSNRITILKMK